MKPFKTPHNPQGDLFKTELIRILDLNHPLVRLGKEVDWEQLDEIFGKTYGIPTVCRGPVLADVQISGSDVIVTFDHVAGGLQTREVDSQPDAEEIAGGKPPVSISAGELGGFALCGADQVFYWATDAQIINSNQVRISNAADVAAPVAVRYAWHRYPRCNLFNSEGLPAEPFRKDAYAYNTSTGADSTPVAFGSPRYNIRTNQTLLEVNLATVFRDIEDGSSNLYFSVTGISDSNLVSGAAASKQFLRLNFSGMAGASVITVRGLDSSGNHADLSFEVTMEAGVPNLAGRIFFDGGTAHQTAKPPGWPKSPHRSALKIRFTFPASSINIPDCRRAITVKEKQENKMAVMKETFGKNQFGETVERFTLENANGMKARIMNHGGTIVSLETPDKNGKLADIVLGHDTAAEYGPGTPYFGCVVGRFANRIKNGTFTLDGKEYTLAKNNGPNALHGGLRGFDKVIWDAEILEAENAIRMTYVSTDGEEGFPGEIKTGMTYKLTGANELKIDYTAESTKATPYNITNHTYFNLAGHDAGFCGGQIMMINAGALLPTDETAIPYGSELPVAGTPFDFRASRTIGERIDANHEQIRFGSGYDHNFCLNKKSPGELSFCARTEDLVSGRIMETWTTEPGVQFYTGNFLDGKLKGKSGCLYVRRGGFCLETQHYPDSPNQPQFPDTILRPGKIFRSQTVYRFFNG